MTPSALPTLTPVPGTASPPTPPMTSPGATTTPPPNRPYAGCSQVRDDGSLVVPQSEWGKLAVECQPVAEPGSSASAAAPGDDPTSSFRLSNDIIIDLLPEPELACGDGQLSPIEACDDGNLQSGDGCATDCRCIEDGYLCLPGSGCEYLGLCGDGLIADDEQCDDGNVESGDGCSATCLLEANHVCGSPGQACTATTRCGNGALERYEGCDDANTNSGDGCNANCRVEQNFDCRPIPGTPAPTLSPDAGADAGLPCAADSNYWSTNPDDYCGDGLLDVVFGEECDLGKQRNVGGYGGCLPNCRLGPRCGDGILDCGYEACDDGNRLGNDGCEINCESSLQYKIR